MKTADPSASPRFHTLSAPASGQNTSITLQGGLTPDGFVAQYVTMPLNLPATYSNKIYVWNTEDAVVPWARPSQADQSIATDKPRGDQPVQTSIQKRGYIIGYAVAAVPKAVCATVFVPATGQTDPSTWVYGNISVSVPYVGIDTITVSYRGLAGYDPAASKNWIGIWRGNEVRYEGDPMKALTITNPEADGTVFLTGLDLRVGASYAVGYFMQPRDGSNGRTSLAAMTSFIVS